MTDDCANTADPGDDICIVVPLRCTLCNASTSYTLKPSHVDDGFIRVSGGVLFVFRNNRDQWLGDRNTGARR